MTNKHTPPEAHDEKSWYVYIVRCRDNSCYTGITTDLARRISEHNGIKKGAKYTRNRQPVKLVYHEQVSSRSAAAKREYQIKKLPTAAKNRLINMIHSPKQSG